MLRTLREFDMQTPRAALFGLLPLLVVSAFVVALAACAPRATEGSSQVADGLEFDYGIVPSQTVGQHPSDHPEAGMHGGAPQDRYSYHVTLAVFDAKTRTRIDDAEVTLKLAGPGHGLGVVSMRLEPMAIAGAMTYGGYVDLPKAARYDLTFEVARPDRRNNPVKARFIYERPD
jgi:hypothetical protein